MGVGIWIMVFRSFYNSLLDSDIYVIVPGLMIAAGVVVLVVGVVGCLGAVKENRFFLISVSNISPNRLLVKVFTKFDAILT